MKQHLKDFLVGLLVILIILVFFTVVLWPTVYTADRLQHKKDFRWWMILGFTPAGLISLFIIVVLAVGLGKEIRT